MFWSILFNIVLIILVIHLCTSAFDYVKVSFFHHFLVPIYALIMFFITMRWTQKDITLLVILIVVGFLIGILETMDLTFQKKPSKRKHKEDDKSYKKWVYQMRRGWPYLAGWILVIVIGLGLSDIVDHAGIYHLFVDKVFEEIFEEIDPLSFFTESHPWYIWILSSVSSLTFAWRGTMLLKHQEEAGTVPILEEEKKSE